jgi:hypothetical protein
MNIRYGYQATVDAFSDDPDLSLALAVLFGGREVNNAARPNDAPDDQTY